MANTNPRSIMGFPSNMDKDMIYGHANALMYLLCNYPIKRADPHRDTKLMRSVYPKCINIIVSFPRLKFLLQSSSIGTTS